MDKIGSKNCGSGREILGYIRGVANQERCGDNSDWHTCRYIYIRGIAKWEKGQAVNQDTKLIG